MYIIFVALLLKFDMIHFKDFILSSKLNKSFMILSFPDYVSLAGSPFSEKPDYVCPHAAGNRSVYVWAHQSSCQFQPLFRYGWLFCLKI